MTINPSINKIDRAFTYDIKDNMPYCIEASDESKYDDNIL